jgi:hypothetical protein
MKTVLIFTCLPILVILVAILPVCNVFGQFDPDAVIQRDIEKYQELGDKGFIKDCMSSLIELTRSLCESIRDMVKEKLENQTSINQTSSINGSIIGYQTYNDDNKGYSVEYPSDWHIVFGDLAKGSREFSATIFSYPKYAILDTDNFANIMTDIYREEDGNKITNGFGQIDIDGNPARTFSYSHGDEEFMVAMLMHNDIGYLFKYQTQEQNFDQDTDTMIRFFGSIKFLS